VSRRAARRTGDDFALDPFQVQAAAALDAGRSVLVAAPTGSGKTVVAEHAIARALAAGGKAFYTTPLKALSNQKFGDLVRRYGPDRVGLLTGDTSVRGDAPVVVMTTEVLRNMIYSGSPALRGLRYVVLDEVHYLQDAYRGPVWEEVIIHTPPEVDLVCLSATVSNAEELADWISTVRGPTEAVIEERRPVDLHNLYLVGDRSSERLLLLPTLVDGRPNPEGGRLDAEVRGGGGAGRGRDRRPSRRRYTPRRVEVVDLLEDERMLPAIYFIFSRAACDDAVKQCLDAGLRLTDPSERDRIRAIAEARVEGLTDADLDSLGWPAFAAGLMAGVAAHHAGMVPPFKEVVEQCFAAGLVKVVFATETLSLGINMPARAVVIEKLTKFTGERHEFLTPGEYTQLTGRAGRRGIDEVGYAIVLWSPWVAFEQIAGLASTRTYALRSSFRPTYNMAANLVRRYEPERAHHLLNLSFAQYQADRDVVRLETAVDRLERRIARARQDATCELGDIDAYRRLRRREEELARAPEARHAEVVDALGRLRPGDVIAVRGGKSGGRVGVIAVSQRRGGDVRLRAVTASRRLVNLGPDDFPGPPVALASFELPAPYLPNNSGFQRKVAEQVRRARLAPGPDADDGWEEGSEAGEVAAALAAVPVAGCPDLELHLRAAAQVERLERQRGATESGIRGRTESLARQFDRVLRLLERWGYLDGWALTEAGRRLTRVYHEADLLIAEALQEGLFDDLDPASVAGLASVFTYEARGAGRGPVPTFPSSQLRARAAEVEALQARLHADEAALGLPRTRQVDPGFVALAVAWAGGRDLDELLEDQDLSGGDFVRLVKQLIDLLRQLGEVAPRPETAAAARVAADLMYRGVVSASSGVGTAEEPGALGVADADGDDPEGDDPEGDDPDDLAHADDGAPPGP
jgi:ATP-dependent RNA helicase HelY